MRKSLGTPTSLNPLRVSMETMHFHISQTGYFQDDLVSHLGVLMNNLPPMKIVLWVHGKLIGPETISQLSKNRNSRHGIY